MNGVENNMIEEGVVRIRSQSPYEQLDEDTREQLCHIKQIWPLWKKSPMVRDYIWNFFESCNDPYKGSLQMMVMSGDFYLAKQTSLAFAIMENFSSWIKRQNPFPLSKELKLDAFNIILRQKNSSLIKLVVETYKMKEDKEMFLEHVRQLCKNRNYKEACNLAGLLELHEHFSIEDFLVPLIFQDKYVLAEKFLEGSERHQKEIAIFLDNLIGKRSIFNEIQSIILRLNIYEPKLIGLCYKPLSKLLTRIIKSFNLTSTICPNLNMKRGKGILQFLLHKKYMDKSIGGESWCEMVMEAIGDDKNLHAELVEGLLIYGDLKEALHWAERFQIPESTWPRRLLEYRKKYGNQSGRVFENDDAACCAERKNFSPFEDSWEESAACSLKFHKLPISESQIKVIDTASGFSETLSELKYISLMGIDAEWKPSFGLKRCDLAIMQIATFEVVYIIDVIALSSAAPKNLWERLANLLFETPNTLKVGFGICSDLAILKETLWRLHGIQTMDTGFLDLAILWKSLVQEFNFVFPFTTFNKLSKNSESLSTLIELCFGESLDKSDQFSNWEKRPLRKSQIIYAALDAYCLLEAYNTMIAESHKQNISVSNIIEDIVSATAKKMAKKKKGKVIRETEFRT